MKETIGIKWIEEKPKPPVNEKIYRVQVGAYSDIKNAEETLKKLKALGFEGIIV